MHTCCVIAEPEAAAGFRLAGVEVAVAPDPPAAADRFNEILRRGGCGLLLVSERLAAGIPDAALRRLERAGLPLVVPIPIETGWQGEERGLEYLMRLIRRAIGYQLRIRR